MTLSVVKNMINIFFIIVYNACNVCRIQFKKYMKLNKIFIAIILRFRANKNMNVSVLRLTGYGLYVVCDIFFNKNILY